jgi:hypothetical protein
MVGMDRRSTLGLKALLTAGAVLAIALLVQTVVNYRIPTLRSPCASAAAMQGW